MAETSRVIRALAAEHGWTELTPEEERRERVILARGREAIAITLSRRGVKAAKHQRRPGSQWMPATGLPWSLHTVEAWITAETRPRG